MVKKQKWVSNKGRYQIGADGKKRSPLPRTSGYANRVGGMSLARTIVRTFLGPLGGLQVDHQNQIRDDNSVVNLRRVTPRENMANQGPRLSNGPAQSNQIRAWKPDDLTWEPRLYDSMTAAATELGVESGNISKCCRGLRQRVGEYSFEKTNDPDIDGEDWKAVVIDGVETGAYVSDYGRFQSPKGPKRTLDRGKEAYCTVQVNRRVYQLHRLVCAAFNEQPSAEHVTVDHHPDLDTNNNSADNLRWATWKMQRANQGPRRSNGPARSHPVSVWKPADQAWGRHQYESITAAGIALGIHCPTIWKQLQFPRRVSRHGFKFERVEDPDLEGEEWRPAVTEEEEEVVQIEEEVVQMEEEEEEEEEWDV